LSGEKERGAVKARRIFRVVPSRTENRLVISQQKEGMGYDKSLARSE